MNEPSANIKALRAIVRVVLPLAVLVAAALIGRYILSNRKEAKRRPQPQAVLSVDVAEVAPVSFQMTVESRGTVQARTQSTLSAEVAGRVVEISPSLLEGGYFEAGDMLLRLDQRDFETAVTVAAADLAEAELAIVREEVNAKQATTAVALAEAALTRARLAVIQEQSRARNLTTTLALADASVADAALALAEEEAKAAQARRDWDRLDVAEAPSALVLREPQLKAARNRLTAATQQRDQREFELTLAEPIVQTAEAAVTAADAELRQRRDELALVEPRLAAARARAAAAEARLAQRRLDRERTEVRAPYRGRVLRKQVDIGQYVTTGTVLATLYATDVVELRLPLSGRDLAYIELPTRYRGDAATPVTSPTVDLRAELGGKVHHWRGVISRTEGAIDATTRQLSVVAQVADPYGRRADGQPPLRVGMYVEATIGGHLLEDVFVLPRAAVREGNQVLIVTPQHRLTRRPIEPVFADTEHVVVSDGLTAGELLCLTPVTFGGAEIAVRPQLDGKPLPAPDSDKSPETADAEAHREAEQ